jgi:hypothetical protein
MFEEGFKRYNGVKILKVFSAREKDASITYMTTDSKTPRFALIREPSLESYTTVEEDCSVVEHKPKPDQEYGSFVDELLEQFTIALKEGLPVNLVIAVLKKGNNVEFVAKAEFC